MPELPEVETTVRGLRRRIIGRKIKDVWTDWPKYFKKPKTRAGFKKCVVGRKIEGVERKGKNILIRLSGEKILLVHQKMSGHLLCGRWKKNNGKDYPSDVWENEIWVPEDTYGRFVDSKNRFIRLIFFLDDGSMMALSDLRRFAKVLCGSDKDILKMKDLDLGPDPLSSGFSFKKFKEIVCNKKGRIKAVLMDQKVISGVGNIYSDEALWEAKIHPFTPACEIDDKRLEVLYNSLKKILKKAVKLKGTSIDDYREPNGKKGRFGEELLIYGKDGDPCPRCGIEIKRIKMGARSVRFCPKCQKNK